MQIDDLARALAAGHGLSRVMIIDDLHSDWPWFETVLLNGYELLAKHVQLAEGVDMHFIASVNDALCCYERNYSEDPYIQIRRALNRFVVGLQRQITSPCFERQELLFMLVPKEFHDLVTLDGIAA